MDMVAAGDPPVGGDERLTPDDQHLERLLLGLRLAEGVPEGWIDARETDRFVADGLATRTGGRVALTDRGLLLANDLVLALAG
jgi:oxygen-independent coproporphyrinogen-3 oxidase